MTMNKIALFFSLIMAVGGNNAVSAAEQTTKKPPIAIRFSLEDENAINFQTLEITEKNRYRFELAFHKKNGNSVFNENLFKMMGEWASYTVTGDPFPSVNKGVPIDVCLVIIKMMPAEDGIFDECTNNIQFDQTSSAAFHKKIKEIELDKGLYQVRLANKRQVDEFANVIVKFNIYRAYRGK